jgi:hypothetical protein
MSEAEVAAYAQRWGYREIIQAEKAGAPSRSKVPAPKKTHQRQRKN